MLSSLLSCLFSLSVIGANVIGLPGPIRNGSELLDLSHANETGAMNDINPMHNASLLDVIDQRFKIRTTVVANVKISGKSTYMNILKAMVRLSYSEGTHLFAGEIFSFPDYTNVKIQIKPATTTHSELQYRHALWGLMRSAQALILNRSFLCIIAEMYWSSGSTLAELGTVEILPDPLPRIAETYNLTRVGQQAKTLSTSLDLTEVSSSAVFIELQGQKLSLADVFMTLFWVILHIGSFPAADVLHDFTVRGSDMYMEFVYQDYDGPRTSPPYFTYQRAARALEYLPKYMFAQGRFETAVFVVEVDGIPLGQGFLRKVPMSSSSITSDKI